MLGTGTFFQDSDEGVPDASLLLLAAARLRSQAKEVAESDETAAARLSARQSC